MREGGEVAVVLGGTGTIGAAIARRLARPGTSLVLGYREDRARAERVAGELAACADTVRLVEGHLADAVALEQLAGAVASLGGRCDRLVHCVALTSFKPLTRVRASQWDLILQTSARTLLDAVNALLEPLAGVHGSVVAVSSQGATRAIPSYGALGAAKAALEATVRQLAWELAPRGVRVNAVRAGLVESDVVRRFPDGVRDAVVARTPLGRLGTPDEVAAAAAYLLGDDAGWITGQVLEVDGGFSLA